jgi:pyruvate dehydrogenase E2 component (dihydrolipoamide acetyltransferase)
MATDVVMPRLSDSMEEGTILKWLVEEGGEVKRGEALVEIETDKANMTYDAETDGTLVEVVAKEGAAMPVGEVIARIGEKGEEKQERQAVGPGDEPGRESEKPGQDEPEPGANGGDPERVKASPLARRMANEMGVELESVSGSGPGGRVVKSDIESASTGDPKDAPAEPRRERREAGAKGEVEIHELTRLQQTVSRRMAESKATAPDFTLTVDVDMTLAVELRSRLKQVTEDAPSYNDMVVKAAATALREHPRVNAAYRDGKFELYSRVNVGIAVGAQGALVVPTIFDADRKSLGQIARDARVAAEKVRAGRITPPEVAGGTFTVSNLGMFGIDEFTAVINPPQAAILTVGALKKRPAVDDSGRVVARDQIRLSLISDQRILYGAEAAEFLARVRQLLEQPLALAL